MPDPFLGSDPTRKPGQTDPESESERHFRLRFRVSLTQIPDQSDPEMGLARGTLSLSNLTREFLECSRRSFQLKCISIVQTNSDVYYHRQRFYLPVPSHYQIIISTLNLTYMY